MCRCAPSQLPVVALAVTILIAPLSLFAQNAPRRPQLDVDADTNSAPAYYQYGMAVIRREPAKAGDAFYWASQIDPTWAQPFYARRIALLLAANDAFVIGYMEGDRKISRSKQGARIDSLELRARMLNPFLDRELDMELVMRYLGAEFEALQRGAGGTDATASAEFSFYLQRYWRTEAPPYTRAILAASERRFPDALQFYQRALDDHKKEAAEIHLARGQLFYLLGNDDSARVEMQLSLDTLRGRDARDFVYLYESKGVLEHGLGLIDERQGKVEQAREAYARALEEDLSYYPAHIRLGLMALAEGDTATALNEMALAAQIKDDDPWVQTTYGAVLTEIGHLDEADQHLRRAVDLAPFYAAPYYALGRVAELVHKPADATRNYHSYLARARAQDPRISEVRGRLASLEPSASPHQ